jgi:N-acyl-phosphatidylethanolamine-hydrolysing phospholipase D
MRQAGGTVATSELVWTRVSRPIRRLVTVLALLCLLVPAPIDRSGAAASFQAHQTAGRFRNEDPDIHRATMWLRVAALVRQIGPALKGDPTMVPLARADVDVAALREPPAGVATVTWVGHSTLLVQLDGVNILTDPHWGNRTGPFGGRIGVRRITPPGIAFEDLPPIDLVLISHDHYDHLDEPTVRRLARTFNPLFVVPLGIKSWLADRGITNVVELDWGESTVFRGLTVTCTPAQHGSGRSVNDIGLRLWASWVVAGSQRFYFGGDSGYARHFKEIGEAYGPFDLAALAIGSYTPPEVLRPMHTSPEEALQAASDLRARAMVPIHWGTFALAREPFEEPPRRLLAEAGRLGLDSDAVILLKPGETRRW